MVKPKHWCWQFFVSSEEVIDGKKKIKAACKFCPAHYNGNATEMAYHLTVYFTSLLTLLRAYFVFRINVRRSGLKCAKTFDYLKNLIICLVMISCCLFWIKDRLHVVGFSTCHVIAEHT